jgi:hypothetical protein
MGLPGGTRWILMEDVASKEGEVWEEEEVSSG